MRMFLTVEGNAKPLRINIDQTAAMVIGRRDPFTEAAPTIDLEGYEALEYGVSRRHAAIACRNNLVQIMDLDTSNGTYLNGHKLIPRTPHILNDGDALRLGRLKLHIHLEV